MRFAEILPKLIGNPVYIWCALELKRYFNISELLCGENARRIYDETLAIIREQNITPRRSMFLSDPGFGGYMITLGRAAGMEISSFQGMLEALERRLRFFQEATSTTVSDNGIPEFTWEDAKEGEIEVIFQKVMEGRALTPGEENRYRSAFLLEMGKYRRAARSVKNTLLNPTKVFLLHLS